MKRQLTKAEHAASRRLSEAIKASPLSQEDIGQELGVTQGLIWQWANGRLPVPARRARALAKALGCQPEEISAAWKNLAWTKGGKTAAEEEKSISIEERITILESEARQYRVAITALADLCSSFSQTAEPSLADRIQAIGLPLEQKEFLQKLIDFSKDSHALSPPMRALCLQAVAHSARSQAE